MKTSLKIKNNFDAQKGASAILMALFVMGILMMIALTAATIMISEIRMSRDLSNSVIAFYAADAAAEQYLYETRKLFAAGGNVCALTSQTLQVNLTNGAVGIATINSNVFRSWGSFGSTQRQVELNW